MRDYSVVQTKLYTGRTMKALRGDPLAQLLMLYLITSPHSTMIGVFHLPVSYIAEDLGSPLEGAREGREECEDERVRPLSESVSLRNEKGRSERVLGVGVFFCSD